jgi:hypothetical protein
MVWHMRNMWSISIRIRSIISGLDTLLLLLLNIGLGELDEFLILCVHLRVMLVTIFYLIPLLICDLLAFKKTLLTYSTFLSLSFWTCFFGGWEAIFGAIFPSQASSPYYYGYLKEVALYLASLTCSLQV